VRLFVALDLPEPVRAALPVPEPDGPWRAVPAQSLHVTLAFLGSLPSPEPVVAAMPAVLPAGGELRLGRARLLPPRRPRVLAVELEDPSGSCGAVQAAVAGALAGAGLYEPEHRRWLPHVTVGRARGPVDRGAPLPAVEPVAFRAETVTLYRSHLGRAPARYEAVTSWALSRVVP
jgi:RNA 2',3'-cyclic 3'-phosphodiesterase